MQTTIIATDLQLLHWVFYSDGIGFWSGNQRPYNFHWNFACIRSNHRCQLIQFVKMTLIWQRWKIKRQSTPA